jgi:predicted DsbA family dithiol-disulfide isomerase
VRIERLRKNFAIETQWRLFPLHPEIPEEGFTIEELMAGRLVDTSQMRLSWRQIAEELGLPWGEPKIIYPTRLAQEMAKWAEAEGKGDEFHDRLFRAYFAEGRNISLLDELVDLAQSVGLPGQEARTAVKFRAFKKEVDSDWARAQSLFIYAVPTFVVGQKSLIGAQPYEVLEKFLKDNGVKKRPS